MRLLSVAALILLCTACSSTGNVANRTADPAETSNQTSKRLLPTDEQGFVLAIEKMDKESIVAELGEPKKAEDVKIKDTNRVVASIWYYEYINTDQSGEYYPLTELDFIDDKVVQVVFLNDGDLNAEDVKKGQSYKFPKNTPQQ